METSEQRTRRLQDALFAEDGSVKLPKLTGLAIAACAKSHQCLTRQPTRERAEAVQAAAAGLLAERGLGSEVRPGRRTETFGLYVVPLK